MPKQIIYSNHQISTTEDIINTALRRKSDSMREVLDTKIKKSMRGAFKMFEKKTNAEVAKLTKAVKKIFPQALLRVEGGYGDNSPLKISISHSIGYGNLIKDKKLEKLVEEAEKLIIRMKLGTALASEVEAFVTKINK